MAAEGYSTFFSRLPIALHERIKADAAADERSVTKWLELHFREYYRLRDTVCNPPTSSPDVLHASPDS